MTLPSLSVFAVRLGEALASAEPQKAVRALLDDVLISDPMNWESEQPHLVSAIVQRIDAVDNGSERLVDLARDLHRLLQDASSCERIQLLLEVVAERERVSGILGKYLVGTISRTGFLSFVAEQRWPDDIRRKVVDLETSDLSTLSTALYEADIPRLEALLTDDVQDSWART